MKNEIYTGGGLILAVVLLLALHIFSTTAFTGARLDLTENRLYSLSEGSRKVLASVDEPITLRLFLSQEAATRLPAMAGYTARVRELLDEYRVVAKGKIRVTVMDPEPFSEEEDRALGYGLRGIPVDEETTFYFGLVGTNSTDDQEVIPFLSPEREEFIEYDLSKMINNLAHPKQKVIGLLSSLPLDGMGPQAMMTGRPGKPWVVMDEITQQFEVRTIASSATEIADDVDVLMLVHPKGLSPQTLYAIDQYVLRGGRALVFVDPYAEADVAGRPGMMLPPGRSDLGPRLKAWGVELTAGKVVGDLRNAVPVQTEREGRAIQLNYPVWVNVPPSQLNADDTVTGKIGNLAFGTPGQLVPVDGATTTVTPLVRTTDSAMLIETSRLGFQSDPRDLVRNYKSGGKVLILAARITGRAASAYPKGPPPKKPAAEGEEKSTGDAAGEEKPAKAQRLESNGDINVIVVADTDLLQDRFWVRVQDFLGSRIAIPSAANGNFVINALDNLTGSGDLISVRSHGRFLRPFTRIDSIRQDAELRFREKEQELNKRLQETERKLTEMESGKAQSDALVLSEAQQREIERFRGERIRIRKELRDVRHELRRNIESLEAWLKFINIALVPLLIGIGGLVVGIYRIRHRKGSPPALPASG